MATMYYRPFSAQLSREDQMPDIESLERILPAYQYIFRDPASDAPTNRMPPPDGARPPVDGPQPASDVIRPTEDESGTAMQLLDYQRIELDKYRYAVHKMGQDIVTLRQRIMELENNNSDLRRQNNAYNDVTRLLQDAHELDGLSLPELASRYAKLKQKFVQQNNQLRQYKQRVLDLQNELIKKNDSMAGLLKMAAAHETQNVMVQRLQAKSVKQQSLEDACKKQEAVIEKLERLTTSGVEKSDNKVNKVNTVLKEENVRLRGHIEGLQDQIRDGQNVDTKQDENVLKLFERLDTANSRIASLEKQMEENARQWGKEKTALARKCREAEFEREISPAPPELPVIRQRRTPSHGSTPAGRRYSKAPPKKDRNMRNVWPLDDYLKMV